MSVDVELSTPSAPPGEVVEVTVIPSGRASGAQTAILTIVAERDGIRETASSEIELIEGEDTIRAYAQEVRDRFVTWLATERPELGLGPGTEWTPTIVQPGILEVTHYLFFSEQWEMGVMWHIMIAPYDWARIYVRARGPKWHRPSDSRSPPGRTRGRFRTRSRRPTTWTADSLPGPDR